MLPAMILTWLFGVILIVVNNYNNENIIPTVTRIAIREQRKNPISINFSTMSLASKFKFIFL